MPVAEVYEPGWYPLRRIRARDIRIRPVPENVYSPRLDWPIVLRRDALKFLGALYFFGADQETIDEIVRAFTTLEPHLPGLRFSIPQGVGLAGSPLELAVQLVTEQIHVVVPNRNEPSRAAQERIAHLDYLAGVAQACRDEEHSL